MNCDAVTSGLTESVLMKKSQCDPSLAPTPGLLDSWTFMEIDRFRLPFSATGLGVFSLTIFAKETIGVVLMLIPVSTFNKISIITLLHLFKKLVASDWPVFSSNVIKDQLKWWVSNIFCFYPSSRVKTSNLHQPSPISSGWAVVAHACAGCCPHRSIVKASLWMTPRCDTARGGFQSAVAESRIWRIKSYNIKNWSYMDVSENSGTPKSSILIGFSIINHPFWGYPCFRKHPYPVEDVVESFEELRKDHEEGPRAWRWLIVMSGSILLTAWMTRRAYTYLYTIPVDTWYKILYDLLVTT